MKKMKLILECGFTQEEYEILKIVERILHETSDSSICYPWVKTIKPRELGAILHHLLFSCRDFLGCIFTLMHDYGYHSAYILGCSLIEYYIDFSFVLSKKEFVNSRAKEYFSAYKNKRKPFSKNKTFKFIEKRAEETKLTKLYKITYCSLCSFKHVNLAGHLVTRRDSKLKEDRKKFLLQMTNTYLFMWKKINGYLGNNILDKKIVDLFNNKLPEIGKLMKQYPSS